MSNHPLGLDIFDSFGPPSTLLPVSKEAQDETTPQVSVIQDIATFGIAGRIWDIAYVLDAFLCRPTKHYTFEPPCPIPTEYFLPSQQQREQEHFQGISSITRNRDSVTSRRIRILEVGAGTGYVGIALAKRLSNQCTVILTDLEEVVPLMQTNVNENIGLFSSQSAKGYHHVIPTITTNNTSTTLEDISEPASPQPSSSPSPSLYFSSLTSSSCALVEVDALEWGKSEHAKKILSQGPIDYVVASDLIYFPELYPPLIQTMREVTSYETKIIFGYKERNSWKETPFWEEFGRFFELDVVRIESKRERSDGEDDREEGPRETDSRLQQETTKDDIENDVQVFGSDDGMWVFVATKRRDEDILEGIDDTLDTLKMMQIGF